MSKLIYLIEQPLDERNYDRFGIKSWIARGWAVEVWDLTPLAYPRVWQGFIVSGQKLSDFSGYFPMASRRQLDYRLSTLEKRTCYIDLTSDNFYPTRVKVRLARLGASRVNCITGSIPSFVIESERRFSPALRKIFSKRLINVFWRKLVAPLIKPALLVVTGENSIPSDPHDQEILRAHNLDYDIYRQLKQSPVAPSGRYAVFLDQNICFHPEYIYDGIPYFTTAERYFPALTNGLHAISAALDVQLTIAAHPRSPPHQMYVNYFAGIPVKFGATAELISNCEFVICHYTTALQYAVLFQKPVIFVSTCDLAASSVGPYIKKCASILGKSVINLDGPLDSVDWHSELRIDWRKYYEYRQQYIKTAGSPEISYWDIVADHLEKARGSPPVAAR